MVYSAGPRGLAEAVTEAFAEEHGVRVEFFAATTGQVMARLEAERHRPRADVVVFASRVAADALKEAGRLRSYPNPHGVDRTRRSWHDPDGYFHATSAAWVGMAIREAAWDPEAHAELEWSDVFLGRFPGRVTLPGPSRSGAAGDFIVARTLDLGEPAWDEYREARRAGLDISAANSQAIGGLLVGAYDVIVGAVDYLILARIEDGAPIRFHAPPSGAALVERPVAILDHTPVPELAEAFVDFYLSPEMQARVAAVHLIPVHLDVPPSEIRARHIPVEPRAIPVDPAEALAEQTRILRRFQLQVERAEVIR
ncbi:MAG: extracellular solute-binding protein [Gemmatimonadales bacterium]|nr:MAG: extracellular solute-binding protein [Gemmatimonadales bacterium]